MTKAKKLPDLFVQFKDGVAWGTYYEREHGKEDGDKYTIVRYTPAKPAKVCAWEYRARTFGGHNTACGESLVPEARGMWCTYCGGKIKVKR